MLKKMELSPASSQSDYDIGMGMLVLLGATTAFGTLKLKTSVAMLHGALKTENFRIYAGSNGRPSAAVIWAHLNGVVAADYLKLGILGRLEDWNSGDQLWFLHVIAEGGKIKPIIKDFIKDPEFKDYECGYMIRRSASGRRRIVKVTRTGFRLFDSLPD